MPKKQMIVLATPSLGAVSIWWARAIAEVAWPMNMGRRNLFTRDAHGRQIAELRNALVIQALVMENENTEVAGILWVDDDVLVSMGAAITLYNHHRPIVSGVYFTKSPLAQPLILPSRTGGTAPFVPDATMDVWAHGMGLCLIKPEVYKRMAVELKLPLDQYGHPEWYKTTGGLSADEDGSIDCGGSEDVYFLDNAAKLGYQPMVDTGRWAFGWHYDLTTHKGYPEKQYDQWSKGQPVVWPQPDGNEIVWN